MGYSRAAPGALGRPGAVTRAQGAALLMSEYLSVEEVASPKNFGRAESHSEESVIKFCILSGRIFYISLSLHFAVVHLDSIR